MHDLIAITPLGGTTAQTDSFPGLGISEQPNWALASVSARHGQVATVHKSAPSLIGTDLPEVGKVSCGSEMAAFWMGPDQWMITAAHDAHEDLANMLRTGFTSSASVTEQTDGWARFDVEGENTVAMFEQLCPLNARAMTKDSVSRSAIEHLGCFVICWAACHRFSVLCPRSSAGSLHHALCTAAKSLG